MNEYEYLSSRIQELIDSRRLAVSAGQCADMEEYRRVTGEIRGLALALDLIKDRERQQEENND